MIRLENIETKDIIEYIRVFIGAEQFYGNDSYNVLKYYKEDSISFIFYTSDRYLVYHIKEDKITNNYFTAYENKILSINYQDYFVNLLGSTTSFLDSKGVVHCIYNLKNGYIYRQKINDKILSLAFEGDNYHTKSKPTNIRIIDNEEEFNYVKVANRPYYYASFYIVLRQISQQYHEKDVFDKLKKKGFNINVPKFITDFLESDVINEYEELLNNINEKNRRM